MLSFIEKKLNLIKIEKGDTKLEPYSSFTDKGNVINEIKIDECSQCHKKFDKSSKSKETIFVFKCGHMLHSQCIVRNYSDDGEFVTCNLCRENEIESSNTNTGFNSIKVNNVFSNSDDEDDDNEKRINVEQMRLYSNMRNMDRRHLEKRTLNI